MSESKRTGKSARILASTIAGLGTALGVHPGDLIAAEPAPNGPQTTQTQMSADYIKTDAAPPAKVVDKASPKAKVLDKWTPREKVVHKDIPIVKVLDKSSPSMKVVDKTSPNAKVLDKTSPNTKVLDKTTPAGWSIEQNKAN